LQFAIVILQFAICLAQNADSPIAN
jgi:hypothetical protein